jgi:hypothetical protein
MGTLRAGVAALVIAAVASTGCWGYNRSAKRGAYVLDSVLVAGGGTLITLGVMNPPETCEEQMVVGPGCNDPVAGPLSGTLVAGAILAVGGLVAFIVNATRREVKTSR